MESNNSEILDQRLFFIIDEILTNYPQNQTLAYFEGELNDDRLDFTPNKPLELEESVCSFLNQNGGTMYVGINSFGKVIGVPSEEINQFTKNIFYNLSRIVPNPNLTEQKIRTEYIKVLNESKEFADRYIIKVKVSKGDHLLIYSVDYNINCFYRLNNGVNKRYTQEQFNSLLEYKINVYSKKKEKKIEPPAIDLRSTIPLEELVDPTQTRTVNNQVYLIKSNEAALENFQGISSLMDYKLQNKFLQTCCAFLNTSGGTIRIVLIDENSNKEKVSLIKLSLEKAEVYSQIFLKSLIERIYNPRKIENFIKTSLLLIKDTDSYIISIHAALVPNLISLFSIKDLDYSYFIRMGSTNYRVRKPSEYRAIILSRAKTLPKNATFTPYFISDEEKNFHELEKFFIGQVFKDYDKKYDTISFFNENLIESKEGYDIKSLKNFKREICGLLNTQGGRIYLGIEKSGKVVGLNYKDIDPTLIVLSECLNRMSPNPNIGGQRIEFRVIKLYQNKHKDSLSNKFFIKVYVKRGDCETIYSAESHEFDCFIKSKGLVLLNRDLLQLEFERRLGDIKLRDIFEVPDGQISSIFETKYINDSVKLSYAEENCLKYCFFTNNQILNDCFESTILEFKQYSELKSAKWSKKNNKMTILKTICSFLNRSGGNICIGISDKVKVNGIKIDKLKDFESELKILFDEITPKLREKEYSIEEIQIEPEPNAKNKNIPKKVIRVTIRPGSSNKIYLANTFEFGLFLRVGPVCHLTTSLEDYYSEFISRYNKTLYVAQYNSHKLRSIKIVSDKYDPAKGEQDVKIEDNSKPLLPSIQKLPIDHRKDDILKSILKNKVTIIEGSTGSGKSTRVVQYLKSCPEFPKGRIALCQPYKESLPSIAERIREEVGHPVYIMSHKTEQENLEQLPDDCIVLMQHTSMIFEILHNPDFDKYSCVIIDEAHEKLIDTDILIAFMLVLIQEAEFKQKYVLSSATLDLDHCISVLRKINIPFEQIAVGALRKHTVISHFDKYKFEKDNIYNLKDSHHHGLEDLKIDSASLNDDETELKSEILPKQSGESDNINSSPKKSVEMMKVLLENLLEDKSNKKHILVFPPSKGDVNNLYDEYMSRVEIRAHYEIFQIHDSISDFNDLYKDNDKPKLIFATKVAQTGITIPNLGVVIDCGWETIYKFNRKLGAPAKMHIQISQSSSLQRRGRLGRTNDGEYYPMYSKADFYRMRPYERNSMDSYRCSMFILFIVRFRAAMFTYKFMEYFKEIQNETNTNILQLLFKEMNYSIRNLDKDLEFTIRFCKANGMILNYDQGKFFKYLGRVLTKVFTEEQQTQKQAAESAFKNIYSKVIDYLSEKRIEIFKIRLMENDIHIRKEFTESLLTKFGLEKLINQSPMILTTEWIIIQELFKRMNQCIKCNTKQMDPLISFENCLTCNKFNLFAHPLLISKLGRTYTLNPHFLYFQQNLEEIKSELIARTPSCKESVEKACDELTKFLLDIENRRTFTDKFKDLLFKETNSLNPDIQKYPEIMFRQLLIKMNPCEKCNFLKLDYSIDSSKCHICKKLDSSLSDLKDFTLNYNETYFRDLVLEQKDSLKLDGDNWEALVELFDECYFRAKSILLLKKNQKEYEMSETTTMLLTEDTIPLHYIQTIKGITQFDKLKSWRTLDVDTHREMLEKIYPTKLGFLLTEVDEDYSFQVSLYYSISYGCDDEILKIMSYVRQNWFLFIMTNREDTNRLTKQEIMKKFSKGTLNEGEFDIYLNIANEVERISKEYQHNLDMKNSIDKEIFYKRLDEWAQQKYLKTKTLKQIEKNMQLYQNIRKRMIERIPIKKIVPLEGVNYIMKSFFKGSHANITYTTLVEGIPITSVCKYANLEGIEYDCRVSSLLKESLKAGKCQFIIDPDMPLETVESDGKPLHVLKINEAFVIDKSWIDELQEPLRDFIYATMQNPKVEESIADVFLFYLY